MVVYVWYSFKVMLCLTSSSPINGTSTLTCKTNTPAHKLNWVIWLLRQIKCMQCSLGYRWTLEQPMMPQDLFERKKMDVLIILPTLTWVHTIHSLMPFLLSPAKPTFKLNWAIFHVPLRSGDIIQRSNIGGWDIHTKLSMPASLQSPVHAKLTPQEYIQCPVLKLRATDSKLSHLVGVGECLLVGR